MTSRHVPAVCCIDVSWVKAEPYAPGATIPDGAVRACWNSSAIVNASLDSFCASVGLPPAIIRAFSMTAAL